MNEALQRIHDREDAIRAEVDAAFEKWWAALPKFGHRDDYWKRILEIGEGFYNSYGEFGRALVIHRLEEIEAEWKRINPPAPNVIMEEVFKYGQV